MLTASAAAAIATLEAAADDVRTAAREATGADQLSQRLRALRRVIDRLELVFAADAAAFEAAYDEEQFGNPSAISWVMEHCRMACGPAANAVCVGEQAERLATGTVALAEGRIGLAHLTLLARTAAAVDRSPTATHLFHEERLVRKAEQLSVRRFRTVCDHVRHQADGTAFLAAQNERHQWRTLELAPCGDDGVAIHGFLDPEGGAVLRSALEPLARARDGADDRLVAQRYADALVELALHALDSGAVPERASQRAHLQVTCALDTLLDRPGAPAAEMEFAGVVAAATVGRVACDATITRVLLNSRAQVIDVGRSQRVVPGATRRALNVRDGGCRWPGCDRSASWTAAHHLVHWIHGGRTDLDNLLLLCRHHHWSVHEGGWQLVRADDGAILTVPPPVEPLCEARAPDRWVAA